MKYIYWIEPIYDGSYRIHGTIGNRRYIGYSKKQAIKKYNDEARKESEKNV